MHRAGREGSEAGGVSSSPGVPVVPLGRRPAAPGGGGSVQDTPAQRCPGEAAGSPGRVGAAQRGWVSVMVFAPAGSHG